MKRYRFDELGWSQFEQVCEEVLAAIGLARLSWRGRSDNVRVAIADTLPAALSGVATGGPVLIALAWLKPRTAEELAAQLDLLQRRIAERDWRLPVCIVTNARGADLAAHAPDVTVIGPGRLDELLDAHPVVRRRVPSLLGVCELEGLLDAEAGARSSWDADSARTLARIFVPTTAYRTTLDVLERHNFCVLSGPPEMGKTAIARVLGLALQTEGWAVHECIRPEQVWTAFDATRSQLFIADDAFGSTEYRPDAAERWALDLDRILRSLDDRHRLVWTSRPAPLRAGLGRIHREHGIERFPQPAEIHVDASALDIEEKALILYRHTRAATTNRSTIGLVRLHGAAIVEHDHFTPERIKRFVGGRLGRLDAIRGSASVRAAINEEIAEPTVAMSASFDALSEEHRTC